MLDIPFYANLRDNTHCIQACLKSILKFYFPQKAYSFRYLNRVTAHQRGKWTWNSAMLLFLARTGFEVIDIGGGLEYEAFARGGEKYLRRIWTREAFETQKKFSDFKREQKLARQLVKKAGQRIRLINRPATLRDIRSLFSQRYTLIININPYVLDRGRGYTSHCVVVTGLTRRSIRFHDPGLPSRKHRMVPLGLFMRAMRYPTSESAGLIGVTLPLRPK